MSAQGLVDFRGIRVNHAVMAIALLTGFVFKAGVIIAIWAAIMALGAGLGSQYNPVVRIYESLIRPRLHLPDAFIDGAPYRFAEMAAAIVLFAATILWFASADTPAWALALVVGITGALTAATNICVGCRIHQQVELIRAARAERQRSKRHRRS